MNKRINPPAWIREDPSALNLWKKLKKTKIKQDAKAMEQFVEGALSVSEILSRIADVDLFHESDRRIQVNGNLQPLADAIYRLVIAEKELTIPTQEEIRLIKLAEKYFGKRSDEGTKTNPRRHP